MDIVEVVQVMCNYCGNTHAPDSDEWVSYGDGVLCDDCASTCDSCCNVGVGDEMTWASDQLYCEDCASNHLFYCDNCATNYDHNVESMTNVGDRNMCERCRDRELSYCERCEEYEYDSDLCDQDSSDDSDDEEEVLHPYSHKPDPIFQGVDKHDLYLGWELETVPKANRSFDKIASAKYAHESLAGLAYLKQDSSIREGFEIVTHPFAHNKVREFDTYWETIETLRRDHYMRSWDTENCGFHIHISRAGFNGGAHLHRFLQLIYGNAEMMAKLGGRKSNENYADWSDVWLKNDYGVPHRSYAKKVKGTYSSRNSAVNTTNEHTIELRFFRGTMNKSSILAHLDLAHACVEYTRDLRSRDVIDGMLKWDMFMLWVEENNGIYPDLYVKGSKASGVNLNNRESQQA